MSAINSFAAMKIMILTPVTKFAKVHKNYSELIPNLKKILLCKKRPFPVFGALGCRLLVQCKHLSSEHP